MIHFPLKRVMIRSRLGTGASVVHSRSALVDLQGQGQGPWETMGNHRRNMSLAIKRWGFFRISTMDFPQTSTRLEVQFQ
jgi:hypothetical protein